MNARRPNILLITADQWRGDCIGAAGHPVVQTPNVDRLASQGTIFLRHFAATAPCSPARASLYTGLYQMNHRVIWNGSPLDNRFDNIARAARRAGYRPALFGYTDTAPDPRTLEPGDPALETYEGILPGFDVAQPLPEDDGPWLDWLATRGHDASTFGTIHHVDPEPPHRISRKPSRYAANETQTAFLADAFLDWRNRQDTSAPWFAHLSFLRPHPPLTVPAPFNSLYDPEDGTGFKGARTASEEADLHPLVGALQRCQKLSSHIPGADGLARDLPDEEMRRLRAIYYGMISEVDAQLGRILDALDEAGTLDETLIVFTSDHAEMMGDHHMLGKGGFFRESYHIPLVVRAPNSKGMGRVDAFTSAVDIFPTLVNYLRLEPDHQPDGQSLRPFLEGRSPENWRHAAAWEFDYRNLPHQPEGLPPEVPGSERSLLSSYDGKWQYVHFEALPNLLLEQDDTGNMRIPEDSPRASERKVQAVSELLSLRMKHNDETLARRLVWDFYSRS